MHCVAILYPNKEGSKFDFKYYMQKHIPMASELLNCKIDVAKVVGTPDGSPAPFLCIARIWTNSLPALAAAMERHEAEIVGDIPNYTNVEPLVQIEETL